MSRIASIALTITASFVVWAAPARGAEPPPPPSAPQARPERQQTDGAMLDPRGLTGEAYNAALKELALKLKPLKATTEPQELTMIEGTVRAVEIPGMLKESRANDPDVLVVRYVNGNHLALHAFKRGTTQLTIVDEAGGKYIVDVHVTSDTGPLQRLIKKLYPQSEVELYEIRDSVLLRGTAEQPEQVRQIIEIAEQFYPTVLNQLRVAEKKQQPTEGKTRVYPMVGPARLVDGRLERLVPLETRDKPAESHRPASPNIPIPAVVPPWLEALSEMWANPWVLKPAAAPVDVPSPPELNRRPAGGVSEARHRPSACQSQNPHPNAPGGTR